MKAEKIIVTPYELRLPEGDAFDNVHLITGDPTKPETLGKAHLDTASSIIVLSPDATSLEQTGHTGDIPKETSIHISTPRQY